LVQLYYMIYNNVVQPDHQILIYKDRHVCAYVSAPHKWQNSWVDPEKTWHTDSFLPVECFSQVKVNVKGRHENGAPSVLICSVQRIVLQSVHN